MQKLKFTIAGFLVCIAFLSFGGNQKKDKFDYDKFKAEKIAYFTNALEITPEEAVIFWPVYNEYDKKRWEISKERRQMDNQIDGDIEKMTEQECIDFAQKFSSFPQKDADLNKEYNEKFLKVLPAHKVVKLYIAEMNFRKQMLRKYRDKDHEKKTQQ